VLFRSRLLKALAVQGKAENIPAELAGQVTAAVLGGSPYPSTLLQAALRRLRAGGQVSYERAALIKAGLVRSQRFYHHQGKEVGVSLDLTNRNTGYLLGRLFAALEKIQEEANPGINATIRDRFYGAASATPVVAFIHLMRLKNHHLAKMDNRGRVTNLERLLGQIVSGIQEFPSLLSLPDQGRFAVGYYHQRQDLFTRKDQPQEPAEAGKGE
jgi:CRISPR-associated protein Csd1